MASMVRTYRITSISIAGLLIAAVLFVLPLPVLNLHYEVDLGPDVDTNQQISFFFDKNEGYDSSSQQTAEPVNGKVDIHVDPLNQDSQSLRILIPSERTFPQSFSATVHLGDAVSYPVREFAQDRIACKTNTDIGTQCTLSADQLDEIRHAAAMRSAVKIPLFALLIIAYLGMVLRLTACARLPRTLFVAGIVTVLLVAGFLGGLWANKRPASRTVSYTDGMTAVDVSAGDELVRDIPLNQGTIQEIRLPMAIDPFVEPTDESNDAYAAVYDSQHMFHDRYGITVTGSDGVQLFDGMAEPDMVDWNQPDSIVIPVNVKVSDGDSWSVSVKRLDNNPQTTLKFYADSGDALAADIEYSALPYRELISLIILLFVAMIIIDMVIFRYARNAVTRSLCCMANYVVLLGYACFQFLIYHRYVGGFPDERAHLSYVAFLKLHPDVVPNFYEMPLYDDSVPGVLDTSSNLGFNYLGHPPLFYQILNILGGMTVDGNQVIYSLTRLRCLSFGIALIGIMLIFYVGLTRIRHIPMLHLLFGLMVISPPNMIYSVSGVSNDSLTVLGVAVFLLGIVRFMEKRYGFATYGIVAMGISITVLAKLTAGLIVALVAVMAIGYTLIDRQRRRAVFTRSFFAAASIYMIPLAYFAYIYIRFHTVQPTIKKMAYEQFVNSVFYVPVNDRSSMGVGAYIIQYLSGFLNTWQTLAGHVYSGKPDAPLYALDRIGVMAVLLAPLLVLAVRGCRSAKLTYLRFGILATCIVIAYQLINGVNSYMSNGYTGGYSSRYYGCVTCLFAFAIIWLICHYFTIGNPRIESESDTGKQYAEPIPLTNYGTCLCILLILLLAYDGFIGSVLYYIDGMIA